MTSFGDSRLVNRWEKRGLIFQPKGQRPWLLSHAALPVADWLGDDLYRVYFSSRDSKNRAQIGFFDINITAPQTILRLSEEPVIRPGPLGAFDDSGVTSGCIMNYEGKKYQYYSGWTIGVTVPFYFYVGLAISTDGGQSFHKVSAAEILGRDETDPYLTASPTVLVENDLWRMWYVSGTGWCIENDRPQHRYHIKYAESTDGIHWKREGMVCIDYASADEHALARPKVIKESSTYKMWFSHRGTAYRLGYAESKDGINWERNDQVAGIDVSESGWDSEMVAYADVFEHKGIKYMLYNGNGYGKTGIGYAMLR